MAKFFAMGAAAHIKSFALRTKRVQRRWKRPILMVAASLFSIGCIVSLRQLQFSLGDARLKPLLVLLFLPVPLTIAYSAVNMLIMAKAAEARMTFWEGVRVTAFAQVAELLPIPGGAIVRAAALVKAGGKFGQSAELVGAFSLLWIACAACGAAIALRDQWWLLLILGGAGVGATLAIFAWITIRFGATIAALALVLRIMGLTLTAWRLSIAFAVIGLSMPIISSLTFAFATIMGSASSIAPGGLGISEGLAALLASSVGVAAPAAFAATAISRLTGVMVCLLLAAIFASLSARAETARREVVSEAQSRRLSQ